MAKKSMIARNEKRARMVAKYAARRSELKRMIKDPKTSAEERYAAVDELNKLPRNASPVRLRNRGRFSGRPRGYYRKFGLARNQLRKAAMNGEIPGLVKSSW